MSRVEEESRRLLDEVVTPGDPFEKYDFSLSDEPLGDGKFGKVYRAVDRVSGVPVAIKVPIAVRLRDNVKASWISYGEGSIAPANFSEPAEGELDLLLEVKLMKELTELNHPHLLKLEGAYLTNDSNKKSATNLYIVMQLCGGGDLFSRLADRGVLYTERLAAKAFREFVLGLKALHDHGYVHRDLKPENLLLTSIAEDAEVVVGDFGLSIHPTERGAEFCGTPPYAAPESHMAPHKFLPASDVWAAGTLLYIMLSGIPPFYADGRGSYRQQNQRMIRNICRGAFRFWPQYFSNISDTAKDLIERMLKVDLSERCSFDDVLEHPWIKEHNAQPDEPLVAQQENLRKFNAQRKFRAAAMAVLWGSKMSKVQQLQEVVGSRELSEEQVKDVNAAFHERATDGRVNYDQFHEIMTSLGYDDLPLRRMWEVFDEDENGELDAREFVCGMAVLRKGGEEALKMCFNIFDEDGDGAITREELLRVLRIIARNEGGGQAGGLRRRRRPEGSSSSETDHFSALFDTLDVNKDGSISMEEFREGLSRDPSLMQYFLKPVGTVGGSVEGTVASGGGSGAGE